MRVLHFALCGGSLVVMIHDEQDCFQQGYVLGRPPVQLLSVERLTHPKRVVPIMMCSSCLSFFGGGGGGGKGVLHLFTLGLD